MIQVKIKNIASQEYTHGAKFDSTELAESWVASLSYEGSPWGEPESFEVEYLDVSGEAAYDNVKEAIQRAMGFGQSIILEFATENVILGITQDGMTGAVLERMYLVTNALNTGSLYEAIEYLKSIPGEDKDAVYITNVRILSYVNKIETYLGLELSTNL